MCGFGMTTTNKGETAHVFKPTCFMTNARKVYFRLDKQCNGQHVHIPLLDGRAQKAEVYPPYLCEHICKGIREQLEHDVLIQRMPTKFIGSIDIVKPAPRSLVSSGTTMSRICLTMMNQIPDHVL